MFLIFSSKIFREYFRRSSGFPVFSPRLTLKSDPRPSFGQAWTRYWVAHAPRRAGEPYAGHVGGQHPGRRAGGQRDAARPRRQVAVGGRRGLRLPRRHRRRPLHRLAGPVHVQEGRGRLQGVAPLGLRRILGRTVGALPKERQKRVTHFGIRLDSRANIVVLNLRKTPPWPKIYWNTKFSTPIGKPKRKFLLKVGC